MRILADRYPLHPCRDVSQGKPGSVRILADRYRFTPVPTSRKVSQVACES